MKTASLRSVLTPLLTLGVLLLCIVPFSGAQDAAVVPKLVNFSGTLTDSNGKPLSGTVGVTFLLYKDQQGGAPVWLETQNVQPDRTGHYSVMLGSTSAYGLPSDIFAAAEARWLAVQPQGQAEQTRVMLLSVPYALKAADAETVGGLPASAFVLATPGGVSASTGAATPNSATGIAAVGAPAGSSNVTTTGGTVNLLPLWTTSTNIQNSVLAQTGSGSTARIGINTATPAATLDVKGTANVEGTLTMPPTGTATAIKGFNSQPHSWVASAFNSGSSTAVTQKFQWQAEPAGNDTSSPSGTLNLLYGAGTSSPAETGLKINNQGLISFASGQSFPGSGTITGVTTAAGSGLAGGGATGTLNLKLVSTCAANQILKWSGSAWACAADANSGGTVNSVGLAAPATDFVVSGSPVTTSGTLNFAWNVAPTTANTVNAIVKRDASGNFSAGTVTATALNAATASLSNSLGIVSGSGTPAYVQSSAGGATTLWGAATASTGQGWGVYGVTSSGDSGAYGVYGLAPSATAGAIGVKGYSASSQGVWGESTGTAFSNGVGSDGVHGVSHSTAGSGVAGVNDAKDATGIYGSDPQGYGFVTDSHVSQGRTMGGWVKAMAYVNFFGGVSRCFNSQLAGSAASISPCGISVSSPFNGTVTVDFGFEIDDRFVVLTFVENEGTNQYYGLSSDGFLIANTAVEVVDTSTFPGSFYVLVY